MRHENTATKKELSPGLILNRQPHEANQVAWNSLPNPVLLTNSSGEIIFSNLAADDLFAQYGESLYARNISDVLVPLHIETEKLSSQFTLSLQQLPAVYVLAFNSGKIIRHVSVQSTRLVDGETEFNLYSLFDIESLAIEFNRLQTLANVDQLTGAYSRRYFYELLDKEIERVKRYNIELSLIMIDLDNFKAINDHYGHLAGDKVLRKFSELIRDNLRDMDIFGRLGGDEFVIVLPETRLNKAQSTAQRIKRLISRSPFIIPGVGSIKLTVSMGVTTTRPDIQQSEQLINFADQALYSAKFSGKDTIKSGFFPEAKACV